MTRKDYILIAAAICRSKPIAGSASHAPSLAADLDMADQHARTARAIAVSLADDNPKFNRRKFLTACGVAP